MSNLSRAIGAVKLFGKAHGPTIMVATGIVSMGASVITASKQTLKIEEVLSVHTPKLEKIRLGTELDLPSYSKEAARKDRFIVYTQASYDLAGLYLVPGVLFFGGAALVFGGHRIMLKRNATLALAFTALSESFDKYRANVREEFGELADKAMMDGGKLVTYTDPVTGKEEQFFERDWENSDNDPYNRVFRQGESTQWQDDLSVNKMFVEQVQRMCQRRLIHEDHLFLSDVYKHLGFPVNDISRVCGWKVTRLADGSRNIPEIDFGLNTPIPDDWKWTRDEAAVYLDFNVHGLIIGGRVQKALEQAP